MVKKKIYRKKIGEFERNCLKCNTVLKKGEECYYYKDGNKFIFHYCKKCKNKLLKKENQNGRD